MRCGATACSTSRARRHADGIGTFFVDGSPTGKPVPLDKRGRATLELDGLDSGAHGVRAEYGGGGRREHRPCSSATLVVAVGRRGGEHGGGHDVHRGHMPA